MSRSSVALNNLVVAHAAFSGALDDEARALAEKDSAVAELAIKTQAKNEADAIAEQALTELLAALAEDGIIPTATN